MRKSEALWLLIAIAVLGWLTLFGFLGTPEQSALASICLLGLWFTLGALLDGNTKEK
jgi:hypothetical protein